jgi:FlaA1/EpsC-like NDP-sugar epimerase
MGLSERKALLVFYALAAVAGLVGSQLAQGMSLWRSILIVPLSWIPLGLFFAWLAKVRVVADAGKPDGRIALIVGWVFKRRMLEVVMDLALAFVCICLAYLIRFDFAFEPIYREQVATSAPWVLGITLASLSASGVYGGHWEHYGVGDVFRLAKGIGTAVLCCIAVAVVLHRFEHFPRSIFPLYGGILLVGLMAVRASFQFFDIYLADRPTARVVIVGIGPEARTALAHLAGTEGKASVAGFVDPSSGGSISQLKGLPVFRLDQIGEVDGECSYHRMILAETQIASEHLGLLKEHSAKTGKALQRFEVRYLDV